MTRKKFIKRLMGCYYLSRNNAVQCAETVQRRGGSYVAGVEQFEDILRTCCKVMGIPSTALLYGTQSSPRRWPR